MLAVSIGVRPPTAPNSELFRPLEIPPPDMQMGDPSILDELRANFVSPRPPLVGLAHAGKKNVRRSFRPDDSVKDPIFAPEAETGL